MDRKKRTEEVRKKANILFSQKWSKFIQNNPDKPWIWKWKSKNTFNKEKEDFIIEEYRKHLAAYRIQNRWKNARVNPYCCLGLNKINRDYDQLFLE